MAARAARERALERGQPTQPISRVGSEEVGLTHMEGRREETVAVEGQHPCEKGRRPRTRSWLRLSAASAEADDLGHGSTA